MKNVLIEASIEQLKKLIRLKPHFARPHCHLGVIYADTDEYQKAIECLKEAVRLKPDMAEAHYGLGLMYKETGDYQKAIECYKEHTRQIKE